MNEMAKNNHNTIHVDTFISRYETISNCTDI